MIRYLASAEFRAAVSGGSAVGGHASVFLQPTYIDSKTGYEQVAPEAFNRALEEGHDVALLVNHDGLPLARTSSGTLRLGVDDVGLQVEADMADTALARDVRTLMERGDLNAMSFGFVVTKATMDDVPGIGTVRTIRDVDLFDVSIVTNPAYAGTDVALRNLRAVRSKSESAASQHARIRANLILARYGQTRRESK